MKVSETQEPARVTCARETGVTFDPAALKPQQILSTEGLLCLQLHGKALKPQRDQGFPSKVGICFHLSPHLVNMRQMELSKKHLRRGTRSFINMIFTES